MLVLTLSVLAVSSLVLAIWLATIQREQTNFLKSQLAESDKRNLELLNRLMSRDPMTYATLSTVSTPSQTFAPEPYYGMTDEQEADRWIGLTGNQPVGESLTDDLAEMGLN